MSADTINFRDLPRLKSICCLALLFTGGGIAGWIYEVLFYRINDGYFHMRGQGFGPWLPIYGFGSVLICLLTGNVRRSKPVVFLVSAAVTGILEFVTGWVLYHLFGGLRLWDYNTEIWNWGNIGGYVCLRSVLLFAFGGLFLIYSMIPFVRHLADEIPERVFCLISLVPACLFLLDILGGYILRIW